MIRSPISLFSPLEYSWMRIAAFSCSSNPTFDMSNWNLVLYLSVVCPLACWICCNLVIALSLLPTSLKLSLRVALNCSQLFPSQRVLPSCCRRYCSFQSFAFLDLKRERT